MNKNEIIKSLESIYSDYYDGLYSEAQLKFMLKKLYSNSNIKIEKWSELILDAQWKYATDSDYERKKQQLIIEEQE